MRRMMKLTLTPIRLWDYAWEYVSQIRALTAMQHIYLDGVTPYEKVCGHTPNISEYIIFTWYQWVWYYSTVSTHKFEIGRWLGPATNIGQGMAYYVLSNEGKVIVRSTVTSVSLDEMNSESVNILMKDFDNRIDE